MTDWKILPLPGDVISCGLRKICPCCGQGLPKKLRQHQWASLGTDTKNKGSEGICEVEVFACLRCGKDRR